MKYSCKDICRYILVGLVGHFGTLIIICLYLIGGGFLFVLLELDNEKSACFTSYNLLIDKLNDSTFRAMAIGNSGYNSSVFYQQMYSMLLNFSQDVFTLGFSPFKDCATLGQPNNLPNWNLANSIFFCATIITTIGYGNITPSTMWGRIVCIIYAFIGIPLMLLFLGNFGEVLAGAFRSVYINLCCCRCFVKDYYKSNSDSNTMVIDARNFEIENGENPNGSVMKSLPPAKIIYEDNDAVYIEEEVESSDTINIPLTVVSGFLIFYMFLGAILFQIWETWDLVAAVYFSFITVSTIGFGDLYPAKNTIGTEAATLELIVAAIYCVVGLAVLSMCLSLIKDEIVDKFVWLGNKLGLIKQQTTNLDDNEENNESQTVIIENTDMRRSIRHHNEAFEDNDQSFKTKFKSA